MDVRFGKIKATGETYANPQKQHSEAAEENFFNAFQHRQQEQNQDSGTHNSSVPLRLNDTDSNILENKAYNNLEDITLKLEQKIMTLEQSIDKISKDIYVMEGLGYDVQLVDLREKRTLLERELNELKQQYANQDISTKLSNGLTTAFGKAMQHKNLFNMLKSYVRKEVFAKVSKKINYTVTLKDALNNLNNINESIDELVKMQIPYGEDVDRYQKLTAYLNKANLIHAQINSKFGTKNG